MVTKYTLHNGIWVKVFDFWFNFIEKINVSLFVSVFDRYHKADMADITHFFYWTDRVSYIPSFKNTYLSWREVKLVITMSASDKSRLFLFFREEVENVHGQSPCVER